jgi:hypothetical protein
LSTTTPADSKAEEEQDCIFRGGKVRIGERAM